MCDMEVIITDSEYRLLKQLEVEVATLREENVLHKQNVHYLQEEINQKNKKIESLQKHIKELSHNAVNMSKRILNSDSLLESQEDKWLKRERQLLEKNLNTMKIKEQLEEGWKREKQINSIKEQKCQENRARIEELEKQLQEIEFKKKQYQSFLQQKQQILKSIQTQKKKEEEQYRLTVQALQGKIKEQNIEKHNLLAELAENQAFLQKIKHQHEASRQKSKQQLNEKSIQLNILSKKNQQLQNMNQLLTQKEQMLEIHIKLLKNYVFSLKNDMNTLRQQHNHVKKQFIESITETKENFNHLFSDLVILINAKQESQKSKDKKIVQLEQQNKASVQKINNLQKIASMERKQQHFALQQANKKIKQGQERQLQLTQNNKQLQDLNLRLKRLLTTEQETKKKFKEENQNLNKYLENEKKRTDQLLKKIEELKKEQIVEMNTEVIQIQQDFLEGRYKNLAKGTFSFKEVANSFWNSIDQYLSLKKEQLLSQPDLKEEASQIINQEFRLIMKRLSYNFQKKYTHFCEEK